jgi:hypothetical protein
VADPFGDSWVERGAKTTIEDQEGLQLRAVHLGKESDRKWTGYYETTDGRRGNVEVVGEPGLFGKRIVSWQRYPTHP